MQHSLQHRDSAGLSGTTVRCPLCRPHHKCLCFLRAELRRGIPSRSVATGPKQAGRVHSDLFIEAEHVLCLTQATGAVDRLYDECR